MNSTIYIRKENEEAWEQLADKSMQVNHWLTEMKGSPSTEQIQAATSPKMVEVVTKNVGTPSERTVIKNPIESLRDGLKLCKHGSDPAFCKHSKPGKECK